jgi:sugar/nucleoside kinase (ribokinase family)
MQALFWGVLALDDLSLPTAQLDNKIGGSAAFGALASSFFAPTILASVMGNDFPQSFMNELKKRGVITDNVRRSKKPSFKWVGRYSPDLAAVQTINREMNSFEDFRVGDYKGKLDDVGAAFLSKNDPEIQLELLELLPEKAVTIMETRESWMVDKREVIMRVMKLIDVFLVREEEAQVLLGESLPVPEMIEKILHMGPKVIVFKKGEHGLVMYGKMGTMLVPSYPFVYAVDPTGAGDVLGGTIAGVLAALGRFDVEAMKTAVVLAGIMASFTVEDYGVDSLIELTKDAIANRTKLFLRQLPQQDVVNFKELL